MFHRITITPAKMSPLISVSLISYGHANGPLVQPKKEGKQSKSLAYNIRYLPNPPRHLRANSTGLSKRLQKGFFQNDVVEAQLSKVQDEIVEALKAGSDSCIRPSTKRSTLESYAGRRQEALALDGYDHLSDIGLSLVVTVCCEEGRHRSVAFIEELARRLAKFNDGDADSRAWCLDFSVTHRDINISTHGSNDSGYADRRARTGDANINFKRRGRRQKRAVLRGAFDEIEDD